jgi:hypothetical protein
LHPPPRSVRCRQMSAMQAEIAELREGPDWGTLTVRVPPTRALRRAERRAQMKLERRDRRRWSMLGCAVLLGAFALTVGVLGVLH